MRDHKWNELGKELVMRDAISHLSEACSFAFELDEPEGIAFAVMLDNALKYAQSISNNRDPRLSTEFLSGMCDDAENVYPL